MFNLTSYEVRVSFKYKVQVSAIKLVKIDQMLAHNLHKTGITG